MKNNEPLAAGEHFKYKGMEFITLDFDKKRTMVLALSASIVATMEFSETGGPGSNDWRKSKIRKWLNEKYISHFNTSDLIQITSDLTADNGDNEYGTCQDYLSLLSCDLYRKLRKLIPTYDDWIWTLTPWVCRSPYPTYALSTRVIYTSGALHYSVSNSSRGVVPACVFNLSHLELRRQAHNALPVLCNPNDEIFEEIDNTVEDDTVKNSAEVDGHDEFVCSGCGLHLAEWVRVEVDDDGDRDTYSYEFEFCPRCGKKVKE